MYSGHIVLRPVFVTYIASSFSYPRLNVVAGTGWVSQPVAQIAKHRGHVFIICNLSLIGLQPFCTELAESTEFERSHKGLRKKVRGHWNTKKPLVDVKLFNVSTIRRRPMSSTYDWGLHFRFHKGDLVWALPAPSHGPETPAQLPNKHDGDFNQISLEHRDVSHGTSWNLSKQTESSPLKWSSSSGRNSKSLGGRFKNWRKNRCLIWSHRRMRIEPNPAYRPM